MAKRDLKTVFDLSKKEFLKIVDSAIALKKGELKFSSPPLSGKTLAMLFLKSSTRTRISFEVGMYQLGGAALFLSSRDIQLGRGETVADTARVLSRYCDAIMARVFGHSDIEQLAEFSSIPVINGLSDRHHPCQALADFQTIKEKKGGFQGIKIAYIGDGNNVCHSLIEAAALVGVDIAVATPKGYEPDTEIVKNAMNFAKKSGAKISLLDDPNRAAEKADVLYTDVWASMGQEEEAEKRKKIFAPYQVNARLLKVAKPDAIVMHCLPAHRGEEISEDVIDGPQSVVFDEAENRLHAQKALLLLLFGKI